MRSDGLTFLLHQSSSPDQLPFPIAFLFISIPLVLAVLWLGWVRPYSIRHGKGYTPGGNAAVTFWVDWQQAGEIARKKGDGKMILLCRSVFWLQVAFALLVLFLILYPALRGG